MSWKYIKTILDKILVFMLLKNIGSFKYDHKYLESLYRELSSTRSYEKDSTNTWEIQRCLLNIDKINCTIAPFDKSNVSCPSTLYLL